MDFLNLQLQHAPLETEIIEKITAILRKGDFINGDELKEFEREFADSHNVAAALGVNSGTDALFLALKALDIGRGDEVITTPFTFIATAEVIAQVGAKPVFVDIDPVTFCLDPQAVAQVITPRTKALLPVHIFGQLAAMDELMSLAKEHNLAIIEDACQAIGAERGGRRAGSFGEVGSFSFFPSKNLGGCGDGGMMTVRDKEVAERIRLFKNHGSSPQDKYTNLVLGINSRLDTMQAAILRIKMRSLPNYIENRRAHARAYNEALTSSGDIICPPIENTASVFHQYTIRTGQRDALQKYLGEQGIPTMIYYRTPLHMQPAFAYLGEGPEAFPEAEKASREVLSLPIYPEMPEADREEVVGAVHSFFASR